ncbi:hypothetical protein F5Y07DRAFT_191862 [Xylaria sp. FL0933]|nr:hypothetical protein F5Y07DRAFT_191862 [Xylaria sp. FL0933]
MDRLPLEIFEHIISLIPQCIVPENVPKTDYSTVLNVLPPIATVSRRFQRAIERRTFYRLKFKASDAKLDEFERILDPERQAYVRQLYIMLPVPPRTSNAKAEGKSESGYESPYETNEDRQVHKEVMTAPLRRLWNFIDTWSETARKGIYLKLGAQPTPALPQGRCVHGPFAFSLLDLSADVETLPALPCIGRFTLESHSRPWNPRVALALTSRMSNLECAELSSGYDYRYSWGRYYSIDKKYRNELVQSIQTMSLPRSVKEFSCRLKAPDYDDSHSEELPKFIRDGAHDPVSCAIRELTKHCIEIRLEGPFHPSLFDPASFTPTVEEQPCWQHTTTLIVKVLPCSPDGSWLSRSEGSQARIPEGLVDCSQLPPGYADTAEEEEEAEEYYTDHKEFVMPSGLGSSSVVTIIPDDEKMNVMIAAFARCCARMPALQAAILSFEDIHDEDDPFEVFFIAPSRPFYFCHGTMESIADICRIFLHFKDWQPTDATIDELKNIGVERYGQPCTIHYLEWNPDWEESED